MGKGGRLTKLREIEKRLLADGWKQRGGHGDHINFKKEGIREIITLDMRVREVPIGTLRRIYKIAGWRW